MTFSLDMLPLAADIEAVDVAPGSAEWIAARRAGIGGSDLARVLTAPWELWAEKTGRRQGFAGNDLTALGSFLEPHILTQWAATVGAELVRPVPFLRRKSRPWHVMSLDALAIFPDGRIVIVDAKYSAAGWGGNVPLGAYLQMVWYEAGTGLTEAHLALMGPRGAIELFPAIRFDPNEASAYMAAADELWLNNVATDIPPNPGDGEAEAAALATMRQTALVPKMDASVVMLAMEAELAREDAEIGARKARIDAVRAKIAEVMAFHGVKRIDFPSGARWSYVERAGSPRWREYALSLGGTEQGAREYLGNPSASIRITHAEGTDNGDE